VTVEMATAEMVIVIAEIEMVTVIDVILVMLSVVNPKSEIKSAEKPNVARKRNVWRSVAGSEKSGIERRRRRRSVIERRRIERRRNVKMNGANAIAAMTIGVIVTVEMAIVGEIEMGGRTVMMIVTAETDEIVATEKIATDVMPIVASAATVIGRDAETGRYVRGVMTATMMIAIVGIVETVMIEIDAIVTARIARLHPPLQISSILMPELRQHHLRPRRLALEIGQISHQQRRPHRQLHRRPLVACLTWTFQVAVALAVGALHLLRELLVAVFWESTLQVDPQPPLHLQCQHSQSPIALRPCRAISGIFSMLPSSHRSSP
jgi:hypothetical protein